MSNETIETPLASGATDRPNMPQESEQQLNEASATAAEYPVQHDFSNLKPVGPVTPLELSHLKRVGGITPLPQAELPAQTQPQPQAKTSTAPKPSFGENVAQGVGTAAAQSLSSIAKVGSHIPGVEYVSDKIGDLLGLPKLPTNVNPYSTVAQSTERNAAAATQTTGGKVGAGLEGLGEFVTGEEALKGLSLGDRLMEVAKATKVLEHYPVLAEIAQNAKAVKLAHAAGNIARTSTVGTVQGLAHGESLGQAATSGAVAGGTGAALEGVTAGVKAIAPSVKEIAGELIPVRASQESGIANKLENVAPTKSLSKFDVQQTQPAVKKAIGNVASEIGSKEISGQTLGTTAKDLAERAEQIKAQSTPVFEKLDELTKDQEMKFSDWQRQESAAYRRGDIEAAKKAKDAQAKILESFKDQFAPKDLQNARANWRQASALQDIHDSLNTKSVVGPTPVNLRPKGTDPGYINGKAFSKQILALSKDGTLRNAGLTPEHIQSLQDLGTLLENSANVHKFGQLAKLTELGGAGLTAVLHPAAAVAGAKVAVPAYLAQKALGRVMTNPETAETFVNLLRGAGVVIPATAAQVTNAIQK